MKLMLSIALLLMGTAPGIAQVRRAMICVEHASMALKASNEDDGFKFQHIAKRTFSLTINREYLSLISAGQSDLYECQKVSYRSNKNRALNTMKCQNATNFLTLDLSKMKFVKSQMDPEDETEVGFSYGSCTMI
jgi:hypothetical protein